MITNPRARYKIPQDLLDDNVLTRDEKIRLLKEWAVDEQLKAVAEEENMLRENGTSNQLSDVLKGLLQLDIEFDPHGKGAAK